MRPLVSILFPCYNAEKYLCYSLESILNQDYSNLQIICINDGSTDKTKQMLEDYSSADTRIEILDLSENRGLIESLNRGIELVKGQYFARMDADDFCPPGRITNQVEFISRHPEFDLVSCGYRYFVNNNKPMEYVPPVGTLPAALRFISLFSTPMTHAAVMGKSKLLHGEYWYDRNFPHSEDYELFSRLALDKVSMANVNESYYWVRLNPESVSVKHNQQQVSSHLNITARNIRQHFTKIDAIDPSLLRIISNRINKTVGISELISGLKLIDELFKLECKNSGLGKREIKEILSYLHLHKVNILIQSNKTNFSEQGAANLIFFLRTLLLVKVSYLRIILHKMLIFFQFRFF